MPVTGRGATPEHPPATRGNDKTAGPRQDHRRGPCGQPVAAGAPAEAVLVVALCGGYRCRALRARHGPPVTADSTGQLLRQAVRRRPRSVLISTGCLRPCAGGCVAAVGTGTVGGGELCWSGRPVGLSMVDIPRRAAALAAWISSSAPDLATLPEMLWRTGVSSGGQAAQD